MHDFIDAHLDLGWLAVQMNRDITQSMDRLREREAGMDDHPSRGRGTVCLPELRCGGVGVCNTTLLARAREDARVALRCEMDYVTPAIAHAAAHAQLAYYRELERLGEVQLLRSASELREHWQRWTHNDNAAAQPVGLILSMEGADPIPSPDRLAAWWDAGLRVLSLVHYGSGPYAGGTGTDDPITPAGFDMLHAMSELGMILDVTHLSDPAMDQALQTYTGPILATHSNARAVTPGQRQLPDHHLRQLFDRDAVVNVVLNVHMLRDPDATAELHETCDIRACTPLARVADHVLHLCKLAGNSEQVGIGSDLDGGFGKEGSPCDLDTIADLQKLPDILVQRGFNEPAIENITHGNLLRFFQQHLPAT